MQAHFSSFTPEAMRAFGQELVADFQRRREFLDNTRHHTTAFLADFRRAHQEAESQRRQRAGREVDARRLFMSELRSGVHALRNRFELTRRETTADIRQMASELRAASGAFRSRPTAQPGFCSHHAAATQPAPKGREPGVRAGFDAHEGTKRPGQSKKRHG